MKAMTDQFFTRLQIGKGSFKELKNGDEIVLLKACDAVDQTEEIAFIFVIIKDYSVAPKAPAPVIIEIIKNVPMPAEEEKKKSQDDEG